MNKRQICEVLTTGQVAKICGASLRTVSKWIDTGALRGYRIPGSTDRRVHKRDLINFMIANGIPLHALSEFRCGVLFFGNYAKPIQSEIGAMFPDNGEYLVEFVDHPFKAGIKAESMNAKFIVVDMSYGYEICVPFSRILKELLPFSYPIAVVPEDATDPFRLYKFGYIAVFRQPCNYAKVVEWIRDIWERQLPNQSGNKNSENVS